MSAIEQDSPPLTKARAGGARISIPPQGRSDALKSPDKFSPNLVQSFFDSFKTLSNREIQDFEYLRYPQLSERHINLAHTLPPEALNHFRASRATPEVAISILITRLDYLAMSPADKLISLNARQRLGKNLRP